MLIIGGVEEPVVVFADEAEEVALFGLDVPFFAGPEVFPPVAGDAVGAAAIDDGGVVAGVLDGGGAAVAKFDFGGKGGAETAEEQAARG